MDRFVKLYFYNRRRGLKPLYAATMAATLEACAIYWGGKRA